jgi:ATP-dependent exoDNAse (exonuclease V) beta subunit
VHRALEELSLRPTLPAVISDQDKRRWRVALQREGVWGEVLHDALERVLSSLTRMLRGDGRGRWVLSNEHAEAHSEWALTTVDLRGRVQDIIIDRSFIDRATGVRWVIEYKNSLPAPSESQEVFVAREKNNYLEQLRRYRDALGGWTKEPLRCALYFTALGYLHAVEELDLPGFES